MCDLVVAAIAGGVAVDRTIWLLLLLMDGADGVAGVAVAATVVATGCCCY